LEDPAVAKKKREAGLSFRQPAERDATVLFSSSSERCLTLEPQPHLCLTLRKPEDGTRG
jgi:hypothetical protein